MMWARRRFASSLDRLKTNYYTTTSVKQCQYLCIGSIDKLLYFGKRAVKTGGSDELRGWGWCRRWTSACRLCCCCVRRWRRLALLYQVVTLSTAETHVRIHQRRLHLLHLTANHMDIQASLSFKKWNSPTFPPTFPDQGDILRLSQMWQLYVFMYFYVIFSRFILPTVL